MDLASLRNAKPADLYTAADAYDALCKAYLQHAAEWKSGTTDRVHGSGWSGPAAAAAIPVLDGITTKLSAAMTELSCIGKELRDYADSFTLAQGKLKQALADAQAKGFTVSEDGAVGWPPSTNPYQATDWEAKQKAAAEEIGKRIGTALSEATRADEGLTSELNRFAGHAADKSGLDEKTASADAYLETWAEGANPLWQQSMPGKDASPTEVNSWWKGLGPDGQQWFLSHHPEVLGNLDGVPADVRDKVNQDYLMKRLKQLEDHPRTSAEEVEYKKLKPIQQRLNQDARAQDGRPRAYLLGIGSDGQGRAILSYGNPDTATDISCYVPGITTTPDSLGKTIPGATPGTNEADNALNVWREADKRVKPGGSVASIVWLGYDPPGQDPGAALPGKALEGAPAYAKFVTGLRANNENAHITSMGHSYGSLLVGQATRYATHSGNLRPPDDVVIIGSPGVGVKHASDLGVPSGHVWVGAANNDPVTYLPSPGSLMPWPINGWVGADREDNWYGRDPASDSFGARRFTVDGMSQMTNADFGMHTKYLTPEYGGPSLGNIASIVTGRDDDVHETQGRG